MKTSLCIAVLAVFLIPAFAFAQGFVQNTSTGYSIGVIFESGGYLSGGGCAGSSLVCVGATLLFLIDNILVPVLFAVAFIVFLYGVASAYIFSVGDPEKVKTGHTLILWGLIGFAVMISIWGLVNVVTNTLGLSGAPPPIIPFSPLRATY